jgi:DNA processing protein
MSQPGVDACDACLRRTGLIAALAGPLDVAARRHERLPEVLALDDGDLIAALAGPQRDRLQRWLKEFSAERARRDLCRADLGACCRHGAVYPATLRDLDDPPAMLHVRGGGLARLSELLANPRVAVVGARRASDYGLEVARGFGRALAGAGITVVSGMALGVDSAAHRGALEARGPTVAVLAGGADVPYPASKRRLYARIADVGCALSEMPPGFRAHRWCFPARNRIIAALGAATVVVEAGERSGSLITAHIAQDLGRDVCAVPGQVTAPLAAGTNALLFDGAGVVRDAQDVLDRVLGLGAVRAARRDGSELPGELSRLLAAVANGRDTLAKLTGSAAEVEAALVGLAELELRGYLLRGAGGRYTRAAA